MARSEVRTGGRPSYFGARRPASISPSSSSYTLRRVNPTQNPFATPHPPGPPRSPCTHLGDGGGGEVRPHGRVGHLDGEVGGAEHGPRALRATRHERVLERLQVRVAEQAADGGVRGGPLVAAGVPRRAGGGLRPGRHLRGRERGQVGSRRGGRGGSFLPYLFVVVVGLPAPALLHHGLDGDLGAVEDDVAVALPGARLQAPQAGPQLPAPLPAQEQVGAGPQVAAAAAAGRRICNESQPPLQGRNPRGWGGESPPGTHRVAAAARKPAPRAAPTSGPRTPWRLATPGARGRPWGTHSGVGRGHRLLSHRLKRRRRRRSD